MKKLTLISTIISCTTWANGLKCLYTIEGVNNPATGNSQPLSVEVDFNQNEIQMANYTPYGVRYKTYEDAVISEDQDFLHIVWDRTDTEQFEISIQKTGSGLLNFVKSVHGPRMVELRCQKLGIEI